MATSWSVAATEVRGALSKDLVGPQTSTTVMILPDVPDDDVPLLLDNNGSRSMLSIMLSEERVRHKVQEYIAQ